MAFAGVADRIERVVETVRVSFRQPALDGSTSLLGQPELVRCRQLAFLVEQGDDLVAVSFEVLVGVVRDLLGRRQQPVRLVHFRPRYLQPTDRILPVIHEPQPEHLVVFYVYDLVVEDGDVGYAAHALRDGYFLPLLSVVAGEARRVLVGVLCALVRRRIFESAVLHNHAVFGDPLRQEEV